jgi:hypothetical protein
MGLGQEKVDVYRLSISYVEWVYEQADRLNGAQRPAREPGRGYRVKEDSVPYQCSEFDFDPDPDFDPDERKFQQHSPADS